MTGLDGGHESNDGDIVLSLERMNRIQSIRENFEPEQKKFNLIYGYDVSLSIESMEDYVSAVEKELIAEFSAAELFAYGPLKGLHGPVSAEHGIGLERKSYLNFTRSEAEINLMRRMKVMMDPEGILNPGKLFDV